MKRAICASGRGFPYLLESTRKSAGGVLSSCSSGPCPSPLTPWQAAQCCRYNSRPFAISRSPAVARALIERHPSSSMTSENFLEITSIALRFFLSFSRPLQGAACELEDFVGACARQNSLPSTADSAQRFQSGPRQRPRTGDFEILQSSFSLNTRLQSI